MLLKTKDGDGKLANEAGMSMKTQPLIGNSGNVVENKCCYMLRHTAAERMLEGVNQAEAGWK